MKKVLLMALTALMFAGSVMGQQRKYHKQGAYQGMQAIGKRACGTPVLPDSYEIWMQDQIKDFKKNNPSGKVHTVFNIPVVFHVIHNGTNVGVGYNISVAQIQSQIAVLNEDYRKLNVDTALTPSVFKPTAADCEINFCLAQTDPNGAFTTGIDRINRNTMGWTAPPYLDTYINSTIKPATIWNTNQYLNIWVMPDFNSSSAGALLGYATFPAGSTLTGLTGSFGTTTSDGVVLWYKSTGRVGALDPTYNKGRTATHEIGHWLGLRHIWGDANCGNDYCNDTPTQQAYNFGCPTFPSVTCTNGPNGDEFMNYMDYSDDPCLNMFSNDQKTRIQTVMTHSPMRIAVAASNKCSAPTTMPVAAFTANITTVTVGGSVNFTDQSTNTPTSWTWTFTGGTPASSTVQNPTGIVYNTIGTYAVKLRVANSTAADSLTKTAYINVIAVAVNSCDSVTNFASTFTPTIYTVTGGGYVAGQNSYGDISKCDQYTVTGANKVVTGVLLGFGAGTSSGTGQTANVNVWNDASGFPGTVLGTSTILYDSIAADATAGTLAYVQFTPRIPVSGVIYVGVDFGYNAGDSLALVTCADSELVPGTAYEQWSDSTWHAYTETPASWGLNVAHLIIPIICDVTGISSNTELAQLGMYPNPTTGVLNVVIPDQRSRGNVNFRVINMIGSSVYEESKSSATNGRYQLDLSHLSAGFYFIEIRTAEGRRLEKIQIAK